MNLNGKVCIVTGAASDIGRGIATRFSADGAWAVSADRVPDAAISGEAS